MKALRAVAVLVFVLAAAGPSLGGIYINDFACTRQAWLGRGVYDSNANYGARTFGLVAKGESDFSLMDFDRVAMKNWVSSFFSGGLTSINQIGNGAVKVALFLTAYDSWEQSAAPNPPTVFGHMFWPGVRISKGQNWDESTATFNNAAGPNSPWHDAAGSPLANVFVNGHNAFANMVMNASSEQWGAADTIGGGADVYVYNTPRPWVLDQTVTWAALMNPDVVGFSLVHDTYNKPWAGTGADDCSGTIYGRLHGLTEYRPYLEVAIDTSRSIIPCYLPADFNGDGKVSFADYLILEAHFGKTVSQLPQPWKQYGDATSDGKVSFADYLILESEFSHTTTPEPATIGLLVLGGLAMLRRR